MDEPRLSPWVDAMRTAMLGGFAGVVVTLPAMMLAIVSGGAGHGNYSLARLFYPCSILLTRWADDTITPGLIALALAQFPVYGVMIGSVWSWTRARRIVLGGIGLIHTGAVALCFLGLVPNFS